MDNNKIGIAYKSTHDGAGDLKVLSGDSAWFGHSQEDIDFLASFSNRDKEFLTFLSFDEKGCTITIVTPLQGRGGDNLSAYIYVPSALKVGGDKIKSAWDALKRYLVNQEDDAAVNEVISETYDECKYPLSCQPSNVDGGNAYVQLNPDYNINDVLKDYLYQRTYAKYKYVFLIDEKNGSMSLTHEWKDQFTSIDPRTLRKVCILLPPDDKKLHGVTVYYKNDKGQEEKFPRYLQCFVDDKVTLVFKRAGFEDKSILVTIEDKKEQTSKEPDSEWLKCVRKTDFHVLSSEPPMQEEKGFCLLINGVKVIDSEPIPESKLSKAKVEVKANGYEPYKDENFDLRKTSFSIKLKPEYKDYEEKILLVDTLSHETLTGKISYRVPKNRDVNFVLRGYRKENGCWCFDEPKPDKEQKKEQKQRFKFNRRYVMIGSVATLVLIFFLALAWHFFGSCSTDKNVSSMTKNNKEVSNDVGTQKASSSSDSTDFSSAKAAVCYLDRDSCWTWKRSEMEKYDKLKGLFDDLNSFRFSKVKEVAQRDLKDSTKLKNLVAKIGDLGDQNGEQFTSDGVIKLKDYEKKLDELHKAVSATKGKKT